MEGKKVPKKKKIEIEELNEIYEKIEKSRKEKMMENLDYESYYLMNERHKHLNKKIIECNNLCLKHIEIPIFLYEEQYCLDNCVRKMQEVESIVSDYMDELKINDMESNFINAERF